MGSDYNSKHGITIGDGIEAMNGPSQQPTSLTWRYLPLSQGPRPAKTPAGLCPLALRMGWMGFPPHQPNPHFLAGPGILGELRGAPWWLRLQIYFCLLGWVPHVPLLLPYHPVPTPNQPSLFTSSWIPHLRSPRCLHSPTFLSPYTARGHVHSAPDPSPVILTTTITSIY